MKVYHIPNQPLYLEKGGLDLRMLRVIKDLNIYGHDNHEIANSSAEAAPDALHFWGYDESFLKLVNYAQIKGIKCCATLLLPHDSLSILKFLKYNFVATGLLRFMSKLDRIAVSSNYQKDCVKKIFSEKFCDKTYVIRNYIDEDLVKIKLSRVNKCPYILVSGNVSERKGQLELAENFASNTTRVAFIGGNYRDEYFSKFRNVVQSAKNLEYYGHLGRDNNIFVKLIQQCNIVVLNSCNETQPNVINEAFALKMLPIMRYAPFTRDELYDDCHLYSSISELNTIIRNYDAEKFKHIIESNYKKYKTYLSLDTAMSDYEKFFHGLK